MSNLQPEIAAVLAGESDGCIVQGDCLEVMAGTPDGCVHCCVTSPPYWGLRDYGIKGQIGLEKTPEEYVAKMVEVFREVRRILRDDGTLWLNMGDSYTSGGRDSFGPATNRGEGDNGHNAIKKAPRAAQPPGLKPKDLVGIPWRVAFALQGDGWWLRQDIIWHKPNPMPESVTDRCTKAHEYIFLLTKSDKYYFDAEAIAEPAAYAGEDRGGSTNRYEQNAAGMDNRQYATRNKRDVWTVRPASFKGAHFAVFPPELIEPCVLAGTSAKGCCPDCGRPWERLVERSREFVSGSGRSGNPIVGKHGPDCQGGGETGDIRRGPVVTSATTGWRLSCDCGREPMPCIILDPFVGTGTTSVVAKRKGRAYIGIDLDTKIARNRLRDTERPLFTEAAQ